MTKNFKQLYKSFTVKVRKTHRSSKQIEKEKKRKKIIFSFITCSSIFRQTFSSYNGGNKLLDKRQNWGESSIS